MRPGTASTGVGALRQDQKDAWPAVTASIAAAKAADRIERFGLLMWGFRKPG
ncbi:hypothetical protein FH063_000736 [Azospirillum argentinense]|uniref:Uncharacterized protein n=1 Tax=Azospirillum argentinense TaxID=2970906 RepID=A0A5B0L359_9PROT|nr:hypothetical protein FH063_000736 [Azospirillum argentinense]